MTSETQLVQAKIIKVLEAKEKQKVRQKLKCLFISELDEYYTSQTFTNYIIVSFFSTVKFLIRLQTACHLIRKTRTLVHLIQTSGKKPTKRCKKKQVYVRIS